MWHWLQIEMPSARRATWGIFNTHNWTANYGMQGFYVVGSNNGEDWTLVHGNPAFIHPANPPSKFGRNTFTNIPIAFTNPGSFRYYRFYFYTHWAVVYSLQLFDGDASRINRITSENQPSTFYIGPNNTAHNAANFAPVDPKYPKGFQAFYVMKHELTQSAWVDFLNCLTWDQQHRLVTNVPGSVPNAPLNNVTPASVVGTNLFQYLYPNNEGVHRMNIRIRERGVDGPAVFGIGRLVSEEWDWNPEIYGGNIPMFNLAWTDITAYLDWAGLRPMTELEYEKAARGDQRRVREEYAWGQPFLPSRAAGVEDRDLPTETPLPLIANYAHPADGAVGAWTVSGHTAAIAQYWPVRAGSFARGETTRDEAGASYWGILNLSDNVPERVINISTAQGRAFTGEHGDGELTAAGFSNVLNWPAQTAGLAVNNAAAVGTGYRGIAVSSTSISTVTPVSWRQHIDAANMNQNHRDFWTGLRGVRTAHTQRP
jgi:formylglycine-generating enzyme required for sulfatase activity